jgi:hypothetical protein
VICSGNGIRLLRVVRCLPSALCVVRCVCVCGDGTRARVVAPSMFFFRVCRRVESKAMGSFRGSTMKCCVCESSYRTSSLSQLYNTHRITAQQCSALVIHRLEPAAHGVVCSVTHTQNPAAERNNPCSLVFIFRARAWKTRERRTLATSMGTAGQGQIIVGCVCVCAWRRRGSVFFW